MSDREQQRTLRGAYDALEFELVECHENLSVPSMTTAYFQYYDAPTATDANLIAERLSDSRFSFIDKLADNGEDWYEFNVTGQMWDDDLNARMHLTVATHGVRIGSKHPDDLTYQSFRDLVEVVEDVMGCVLQYEPEDDL